MAVVYLPEHTAERLKQVATKQRRQLGAVVEIMLDYEDQRHFAKMKQDEKNIEKMVRS